MKFKSWLNEGAKDWSETAIKDDVFEILKKNCKKNLKSALKDDIIYKGVGVPTSLNYMIGDSTKGSPRKSVNTLNYYTLLIDGSKYWTGYPKRSRSFICSYNKLYAHNYGTTFIVIPYDGVKIGVCPRKDIWYSFKNISGVKSLDTFNSELKRLFKLSYEYKSWKELANAINAINFQEYDEATLLDTLYYNYDSPIFNDILRKKIGRKTKESNSDIIENEFDPEKNGFHITKHIVSNDESEVWFSGKCVFINLREFIEIEDELKDII